MPDASYADLRGWQNAKTLQVTEKRSPCLAANCSALVPFLVLLFTESPERQQPCHNLVKATPDSSQAPAARALSPQQRPLMDARYA